MQTEPAAQCQRDVDQPNEDGYLNEGTDHPGQCLPGGGSVGGDGNGDGELKVVAGRGGDVSRYNLASEPLAFATNHAVQTFLQVAGSDGLPLVLVDGVTAMTGRYPDRAQLVAWSGVKAPVSTGPAMLPITETGSPGTGCCSSDGSDTTCC